MIAENIARVREQIALACQRGGRSESDVTLIAVSKTHPAETVLEALRAGIIHLGESRVEEAEGKIATVHTQSETRPIWHMIGHLQSRKAKNALPLFDVIQSIDSVKLAQKLSRLAQDSNRTVTCLLEMNISGEESKSGFDAHHWNSNATTREALWQAVHEISQLPNLRLDGLMTIAPYTDDEKTLRGVFGGLRELRDALAQAYALPLPHLSMGMTDDFPIAIEEGATLIRVGRGIFGDRPTV